MITAIPPLKSFIPSSLKTTGLYSRLKNSCIQDIYWEVSNRQLIDSRRTQVEFYRRLLEGFRAGDLVFDIGANVGERPTRSYASGRGW